MRDAVAQLWHLMRRHGLRSRAIPLAVVAGLCLVANRAKAQDRAAYERRLDSLVAATDSLQATVKRISISHARGLSDTIRVGDMVVATDSPLHSIAEAAAREASDTLKELAGGSTKRLAGSVFTAQSVLLNGVSNVAVSVTDRTGVERQHSYQPVNGDGLAKAWIWAGTQILQDAVGGQVRSWTVTVPLVPWNDGRWTAVRLSMVTGANHIVRQCMGGDIGACGMALELTPTPDPLSQWYDEQDRIRSAKTIDRYELFDQRGRVSWRGCSSANEGESACDSIHRASIARMDSARHNIRVLTSACVGGGVAACDSLFDERYAALGPTSPLSTLVHQSVMREALSLGGTGAYERLASSRGTAAHQIEVTSGVPLDSVLRVWQRKVMTTALGPTSMDPMTIVSSLFWALVCGTMALRSSRWR